MKWRLLMWFVLPLISYYALLYLVIVLLTSGGDLDSRPATDSPAHVPTKRAWRVGALGHTR